MNNLSISKNLLWHFLFWLGYLLIRIYIIELYPGTLYFRLQAELIEVPLKMAALYFAIFVLIQKLLLAKQYMLFSFSLIIYVLIVMFLNRVEDYYIIYRFTGSEVTKYNWGFWNVKAAFLNLIYIYPVVGLGVAIYFVKSWFENHLLKEKLARDKAEIELKSLKDQIHPHFLFNTLNNIYSLSLIQSPKTSGMLLKLSNLLHYMVYDGNKEKVSLQIELQSLRDYVELEQIRLGKRLEYSFEVSGEIEKVMVAPLLLFPIIENCFKHGCHVTTEKVWISFNLFVTHNAMQVQIENSLPENENAEKVTGGIGIENVRKRLSLLYPDHEFRLYKKETFLIYIKINHPWYVA